MKQTIRSIIKTPAGICPFCHISLVALDQSLPLPHRRCPGPINHCPYHFVLKAMSIDDGPVSHNFIEFRLKNIIIKSFQGATAQVIQPIFGGRWIFSLPPDKLDFSDIQKMRDKIQTLMVFS